MIVHRSSYCLSCMSAFKKPLIYVLAKLLLSGPDMFAVTPQYTDGHRSLDRYTTVACTKSLVVH